MLLEVAVRPGAGAGEGRLNGTAPELNLLNHAVEIALEDCTSYRWRRPRQGELHIFRRRYFDAAGNMRRSSSEHRQIFEFIDNGATAPARRLAHKHVLEGRQRLLATMDALPAVAAPSRRSPAR